VRAAEAERLLAGAPVDGPLGPAAESAAGAGGAVEDANGSIEYKENLVRVLVERALREALA
jgi:CO/xanthine dehydrogenase FAD-binding subunit